MYNDGEEALRQILELVEKCPKEFQQTCFETLMSGYVEASVASFKPGGSPQKRGQTENEIEKPPTETAIPAAVLTRFKNTAKRMEITLEKLESLFDFSVDPFILHAVTVPGKAGAEKTRNVALLAASRSYMASGTWSADWQEVKSLCIDHNCYTGANHFVNLQQGAGTLFKSVERGKTIELSTSGVQDAEKLLKALAEANTK